MFYYPHYISSAFEGWVFLQTFQTFFVVDLVVVLETYLADADVDWGVVVAAAVVVD